MRINRKKILKRARRWLAVGKKTQVIRFLEPKVTLFLEDPDYYAILGRAYLEAGLNAGAETYLNRGLQTDPDHLDIQLCIAVNHLKKYDISSAVRTWLVILEDYPQEKNASKGLKALKSITNQDAQEKFLKKLDVRRFLPHLSSLSVGAIFFPAILVLLLISGLYFRDTLYDRFRTFFIPSPQRLGAEKLLPVGNILDVDAEALYPMDANEITRTFKKAVKYYQAYKDNHARYELNKLTNSNITPNLRQKIDLLKDMLSEPALETLDTNFDYTEVYDNPLLYEDCWVLWRGAVANLSVDNENNTMKFDLLVGFEEGKILEGRVVVHVPFIAVMEQLPLEILARVVPDGKLFHIEVKTLHFIR